MSYRTKLLVLTLLPILIITFATYWVIDRQAKNLANVQAQTVKNQILEQKKEELRNYVALAEKAIAPTYNSVLKTRRRAQADATEILRKMSSNTDQYFFVYDGKGRNIVEPRLTYFIGKDMINLRDKEGRKIIAETIEAAKQEDAFVTYIWQKPSTKDYTQKLVHATYFPKWDWVVGTGIYLDDIDHQTALVNSAVQSGFQTTQNSILLFAFAALLATWAILASFQFSQQRLADAQLRRLNRRLVDAQETERKRVSTELHDSISQLLVSSKYGLESALSDKPAAQLERSIESLDQALGEVRRISLALRPSILDDLGLSSALEVLANDFSETTGITCDVDVTPVKDLLQDDAKTALYRIAQEALTNITKHSNASKVSLHLQRKPRSICLTISDNGTNFALKHKNSPVTGLGLRNMHERIDSLGGKIKIQTKPKQGVTIAARLPISRAMPKASS